MASRNVQDIPLSTLIETPFASSPQETEIEEIPSLANQARTPWPLLLWIALTPMVAIFIGGVHQAWALAVVAGMVASCFLLLPPRIKPPLLLWLLPLAALLFSLLFLLPVGDLPAWRLELLRDFQIDTGTLTSAQPWCSFERWLLLALCLLWLAFCITRGFSDSERRLVIQVLVVGISAIIVFAIVHLLRGLPSPFPWRYDDGSSIRFGPLPNRNHFSGLCAITGILAFVSAYDAFRRKKHWWILFTICLAVAFAGIMLNTSRFGVVMFFAGLGIWMVCASLRTGAASRMAVFTALMLFATTLFLIYGQAILSRFTDRGGVISTLASDGRVNVYRSALRFLFDAPASGWGLGNFDPVFAAVRGDGDDYYRAAHPESDLLWFSLESGIPATICLLGGLIVLIRHFSPWRNPKETSGRRDRRMRNAAATAALMLVAQGLIDVPLHTVGMATLAGLLAGLGYRPQESAICVTPSRGFGFRLPSALFCLSCAILWVSVARETPLMPAETVMRQKIMAARDYSSQRRYADALKVTNEAIAISPLTWNHYFRRAVLKLWLRWPPQEALNDFARARRLEPSIAHICITEARLWAKHHPPFAMPAIREAMRRDPVNTQAYYAEALGISQQFPALRRDVRALANAEPKLHLLYTLRCEGAEFVHELQQLLLEQPELEIFTPQERLELFRHWHSKADRQSLIQSLENKPDWLAAGWSVLASHHAQQGNYRAACEVAQTHLKPPFEILPPQGATLEELSRSFLYNPNDIARGLQLYELQKVQNNIDDALGTLDDLAQIPSAPDKIIYERAVLLIRKGEFAKAWEQFQAYIAKTNSY